MSMREKQQNIVVLASCGGGNFRSVVQAQKEYGYHVSLLIVDRNCGAIDKAKQLQIPWLLLDIAVLKDRFFTELDKAIPENTDLIVLAGFVQVLNHEFCARWHNRIINTHPSLLPRYGGKGMIGVKVHEAVMRDGEKLSGCTVHFVDEGVDSGAIILQTIIAVNYDETPWELGGRVHEAEKELLPRAIALVLANLKQGADKN